MKKGLKAGKLKNKEIANLMRYLWSFVKFDKAGQIWVLTEIVINELKSKTNWENNHKSCQQVCVIKKIHLKKRKTKKDQVGGSPWKKLAEENGNGFAT